MHLEGLLVPRPSHCLRWVPRHMRLAVAGDPVAEALVEDMPVPVEAAADLMAVFFLVGTIAFIVPMVHAGDPMVRSADPTVPMDRVPDFGVPMVQVAVHTVGMARAGARVADTVGTERAEAGPVADRAVA